MASRDLHASALVLGEAGVLVRGRSGAGKSSLALALIQEAARRGWFGCLVGDDRVSIEVAGGRLIVRGHPALHGRLERRGEGLLSVPFAAAARVRMVVDLVPEDALPRLPEPDAATCTLHTVTLARLLLPERDARPETPGRVLDILTATGKNSGSSLSFPLPRSGPQTR